MPQVTEREIDPCAGVIIDENTARELKLPISDGRCENRMPVRIKGYDDKWRCPGCNAIHAELVFADTRFKGEVVHGA